MTGAVALMLWALVMCSMHGCFLYLEHHRCRRRGVPSYWDREQADRKARR